MNLTSIKQKVLFNCSAALLYRVLLNSELHGKVVSDDAFIEDSVGASFDIYHGYITGLNVELIPSKKIVQKWRANELEWPENHFSLLSIELKDYDGKCELKLVQENLPIAVAESILKGWTDYYWEPLKILIAEGDLNP